MTSTHCIAQLNVATMRESADSPAMAEFMANLDRINALAEAAPGPACRWWEATLRLVSPVTDYRFLVVGDTGIHWLNGRGVHRADPGVGAQNLVRDIRLPRRHRALRQP